MDLVDFSNLLLRSVMSPSITSFCILVLFVLQLAFSRFRDESHLNTQFRVALIFSIVGLLVALGALLNIDMVGSLSGLGAAVTPVVLLMAFVGVAFVHGSYIVAGWLLLVLVSFEIQLTGAKNFWLYLFDPIAVFCAVAFLLLQRRRFSDFKLEEIMLQRSVLVVIAVFLGYAVFLSWNEPELFRHALVVEDGFVEWATVIVLMITMVVCFRRVLVLRQQRSGLFLSVTFLLGLLCLFGAGEEVSWGQRVLGLESPDFFQDNNAQGEIGLHNLVLEVGGERLKVNKLIFGTGLALAMLIYLFVATPLYRRNHRVRGFFDAIAAPMPQNYQILGYILIVATVELFIDHSKRGEMTELLGATMFALNVIYPANGELFQVDR